MNPEKSQKAVSRGNQRRFPGERALKSGLDEEDFDWQRREKEKGGT